MSDDTKEKLNGWVVFGIVLTIVWLGGCIWSLNKSCKPFASLDLNAQGDFVAGASSALAFLWLFIATMLQKQELGLQRVVSSRQADELEQQRKILEKQAGLVKKQTEIQAATQEMDLKNRKLAALDRRQEWAKDFIQTITHLKIDAIDVDQDKIRIHFQMHADSPEFRVMANSQAGRIGMGSKRERISPGIYFEEIEVADPKIIYFVIRNATDIFAYAFYFNSSGCGFLLTAKHLIPYEEIPRHIIEMAGFQSLDPVLP
ncbi:MAG TPA: hypothetical protein VIZ65_01215 [Cellvibrionaceae bacterium]